MQNCCATPIRTRTCFLHFPCRFAVCANDAAELYLSTDAAPANKAQVAVQAEKCGEWNGLENVPGGSSYSDKIELVGGQNYWIEAVHVHRDSVASNNSNFLQVRRHQC